MSKKAKNPIEKKKLSDVLNAARKRDFYQKGEKPDLKKACEYDMVVSSLLDLETLEELIKSYKVSTALKNPKLIEEAKIVNSDKFYRMYMAICQVQAIKDMDIIDPDDFSEMALALKGIQKAIKEEA